MQAPEVSLNSWRLGMSRALALQGQKEVNTLYSLKINGVEVCRIEFEAPPGLLVRPRLNRLWLRAVVAGALSAHYRSRAGRVVTA